MKLTKKLEKEVIKAYETYFDNYIKGNVEAITFMLDEDYNQIGSAESEVFFNKKDAVKFLYDTIDQVAGKTEIRNRILKVEPVEDLILVTDLFDIYALIESDWNFYSKFRASTLMQKKKDGWKFIHQHSSMPDTRTDGGENIAIEKIAEENQQLREGIKRRTIELENKNSELEIETSLEKVRAIALSMKEPADMLDVCKIISLQLQSLGVEEIRNVQTAIFYEKRGTYMNYEHYAKHKKTFITETVYTNNKTHKAFAAKMLKGKGEIFITHIKGQKVKEWITYQKTTNVFVDKYLNKASSLNYYWYSLGPVALGISTYSPLSEDDLQIFNRFRKVFELAYKRFIDIEKAEAQAKEAKIEASLERVRSRAMAIRKSDELVEVIQVIFQELSKLEFDIIECGIATYDNNKKGLIYWVSNSNESPLPTSFKLQYFDHPILVNLFNDFESGIKYRSGEYSGELLKTYWDRLFVETDFKNSPQEYIDSCKKIKHLYYTQAAMSHGFLEFMPATPLPDEKVEIIKRFTNVIDLTYTRFDDVVKAEAQAREAQIELALERVRARTMAMQISEELNEVVAVLYEQMDPLGFATSGCEVIFCNEKSNEMEYWYSDPMQSVLPECFYVPRNGHPILEQHWKAWKRKKTKIIIDLSGKNKREFDLFLFEKTDFKKLPYQIKKAVLKDDKVVFSHVSWKYGLLGAIDSRPLSIEKLAILKRFATVFEQTYTRFFDLQKAEAQAREAQIELALERVRARTMAMHESEELGEISFELFKHVQSLGIATWHCAFNIYDEDQNSSTEWGSNAGGTYPKYKTPREGIFLKYFDLGQTGETFHIEVIGEDKCADHYAWLCTLPGVGDQLLKLKDSGVPFPTSQIDHVAYFKYGYLIFITYEPAPEAYDIFKRFAKVFEQTYIRFLDLQKAEAQAREAQIETALERVRSRTMGMQKSEELKEVIQAVYEQFVQLNIHVEHTGFIMDYKARDDMHIWLADKHEVPFEVTIPYFDCAHWNSFNEAKAKGMDFFANHLTFEEKNRFYKDLFKLIPDAPEETLEFYLSCPGLAISTVLLESVGLYIENFSGIPYTDEENNTLMRFGKVFQQTYTRFLDLQKAETQAREAQIEASLERVRSRAMAMNKSDELAVTAVHLFEQLSGLGIHPYRCNIGIIDAKNDECQLWSTTNKGDVIPFSKFIPLTETPLFISIYDAWKNKLSHTVIKLVGKDRFEMIKYFIQFMPFSEFKPKEMTLEEISRITSIFNIFLFKQGFIAIHTNEEVSEQNLNVIQRFTKVFEQTYTRFLDLQKAEAQAREAQIEAALERVRSKTMAMHNSQDVGTTVVTLFDEVLKLGLDKSIRIGIGILEGNEGMETWSATSYPDGEVDLKMGMLDMTIHPMLIGLKKAWKSGKTSFSYDYIGDDVFRYYEALNNEPEYPFQVDLDSLPENEYHKSFFYSEGILFSFAPNPISDEATKVLNRFAGVFGQTYRRYLDLQKAEAQAKEAQIEAALERVRSKAMAMHSSEDLALTVDTFFSELNALNVTPHRCGVGIMDEESRTVDISANTTTHANKTEKITGKLKLSGHPVLEDIFENWKLQKEYHPVLHGNEILDYYQVMNPQIAFPDFADDEIQYGYYFFFEEGGVFAWTDNELAESDLQIFRRYTSVLSLTYRRYIDLKEAEAQAKESRIEAALERVRASAMAMHKSEDLTSAVGTVFFELDRLGFETIRCGIGIFNDHSRKVNVWTASSNGNNDAAQLSGDEILEGHPLLEGIYDAWQNQHNYSYVLEGKELLDYYNVVAESNLPVSGPEVNNENVTQHYYVVNFPAGGLFAFKESEFNDEAKNLMRRFADVFHLTFTRHLDLKEAEVRAREAEQQASLDRVRAEIASMRTTDDLEKITPLIWSELTTLGLPFFRCGIFIIDEADMSAHGYLSTPSGKTLGTLHLKIDEGHWIDEAVKHWQKGKIYYGKWNREQFIAWTQTMIDKGFVENREHFQDGKEAPENLYLQLLPFAHGMLYVGSKSPLNENELALAQKLADAFGVAFARYEDFQKLEAANLRKSAELEEARQLQLAMLPKNIPETPNLDIAVYMQTATEVGGDYYDFILSEDGTLTVVIGDATGHGMKAGTMVTITKSLFNSSSSDKNILNTFAKISDVIKNMKFRQLSMCLQMLKIKGNHLSISSAAMPPALIYRHKTKNVDEIFIKAMPLGTMTNFPYSIEETLLEQGDIVLLMSDGFPELQNSNGEMYGYDRGVKIFQGAAKKSSEEIISHLKNEAAEWTGDRDPDDDITFVVIKVK